MKAHDAGQAGFIERLTGEKLRIDTRLMELLPPPEEPPASLNGAMRYATLGGGKRLRGILCVAVHELFGRPRCDAALDAACAIECLHSYTLIHDDLPAIDDDDTRRGKPSCHVKYGEAVAILAGDALQAMAFRIISECAAPGDLVTGAVRILSEAAGSRYLVGGQAADLEGEGMDPTEERVEFIHSRKTAELIAASMSIGAMLAGVDSKTLNGIHGAGRRVGFAFQIVDDLLDLEGDEALVGKGLRKDSKKAKITHPACHGSVRSREIAAKLIEEATLYIKGLGGDGFIRWIFSMILKRAS